MNKVDVRIFTQSKNHRMKHLLLASALFVLIGCNENSEESVVNNPELDKLEAENLRLKNEKEAQERAIDEYVQYFNEVRENLNEIKSKQGMITTKLDGDETIEEVDLKADVEAIGELMTQNQKKMNQMKQSLKDAHIESDQMERMIMDLSEEVAQRNMEIYNLQTELETIDAAYAEMFTAYQEKVEQLANTTEELNTAFYAFGSSKELKENGVITKEGGFIGLGKIEKLKSDFNKSYFTEVDITAVNSISLGSKKAELLTNHPVGSYEIIGEDVKEKLVIKNAKEFWSVSKYLVIVVE